MLARLFPLFLSLLILAQPGACADEAKNDYFAVATSAGASRWPTSRMPIKVFLKPANEIVNFKPGMTDLLQKSFEEWANASRDRVSFQFVDSEKGAQIVCDWTNDAKRMMGTQESGQAMIVPDREGILEADITVLISSQAPMSDAYAHRVFLHEVGHALGIMGHSPNKEDMMFGTIYPDTRECALTEKDKNTLITLYTSQASALTKTDPGNGLHGGDSSSITMRVLKLNAEAGEASNRKNYTLAIQKLEEARKLDPTNRLVAGNLGSVYANCAAVAGMCFQFPLAESYFQKAIPLLEETNNTQTLLTVLRNYSNILKMTKRVPEAQKIDDKIASLEKK